MGTLQLGLLVSATFQVPSPKNRLGKETGFPHYGVPRGGGGYRGSCTSLFSAFKRLTYITTASCLARGVLAVCQLCAVYVNLAFFTDLLEYVCFPRTDVVRAETDKRVSALTIKPEGYLYHSSHS